MNSSVFQKIWRVVYPAFLLLAVYLAVYLIAMPVYGTFFSSVYPDIDSFMERYGDVVSIAALIAGGLIAFLFYRRDCVRPSDILRRKPQYLLLLIICGILAGHGLNILISLININGLLGTYTQTEQMLDTSGIIITAVKSVILAPLAEELAFRGLAFRRMYEYSSFWPAAIVSSLFFAIYHMNLMQGIYAFLFGMLLCFVYRRFANLTAPIAMHAAANLIAIILQVLQASYPSVGVYIAVMAATLAAAAIIITVLFRKIPDQM